MMDYLHLENKINLNKAIDFGDILSKSFELFKKTWLQGFLMMLLSIVISIPVMFLAYIPILLVFIPLGLMSEEFARNQELGVGMTILMIIVGLLVYLFVFTIMFAVQFLMKGAYYKICYNKDVANGAPDDYFSFFKKRYLLKAIQLGVVSFIAIVLGFMFLVIPGLVLMVPIMLLPVVFAFNPELSARELFTLSLKLGLKKWFMVFGLIFVSGIVAQITGMMLCGIGVFITMSFGYLPVYYVYKDVIGFRADDPIAKIGME